MKKKLLLLVLALLLVVFSAIAFSSCDEEEIPDDGGQQQSGGGESSGGGSGSGGEGGGGDNSGSSHTHTYGTPVWTWDGYTPTAKVICTANSSHTQTLTATVTNEVTKEATCTEEGTRTYTASVTFENNTYTDTKIQTIDALGHDYSSAVWTWTDFTAKAKLVCENDSTHIETLTAIVTNKITKNATASNNGTRTHTAKVTFNGKNYSDVKNETIPALGHDFEKGVWTWNGYTAKLSFVCQNESDHIIYEIADISNEVTSNPTCTENGERLYTATVLFDGQTYMTTKTESIEAIGHDYSYAWSWNDYTASIKFTCSNNTSHIEIINANITNVITTPVTCTTAGERLYTATSVFEGITYTDTKKQTIETIGHHIFKPVEVIDPTCLEQGYTNLKCENCEATSIADYTEPLDHDLSTHYTFNDSTCIATGIERYECSRCDYYKDETISLKEHDYKVVTGLEGYITYECSVCTKPKVELIPYNITYTLAGGTATNPTTYNIETPTITLQNPTRVGYTFLGWTGSDTVTPTENLKIQIGSTGHRTYTANWKANTNTKHVVKHHLENIADSNYTLDIEENLSGTSDTSVTPAVKTYTGFTSPQTKTETIKADGTLVVDYYYTRNSYTITLVTNGGNALASITQKYQSTVTLPDATREGYTFGGWFTDKNLTTLAFSEMPANDSTIYAWWTEENKPSDFTYSGTSEITITGYVGSNSTVHIPEYIGGTVVNTIGDYSFKSNATIKKVIIPNSVILIDREAFASTYISNVKIGDQVKTIGGSAFHNCPYLTKIEFGKSLETIGASAFYGCSRLGKVVIPDGVTSIGAFAFEMGCNYSVTIPISVTDIGAGAFSYNNNLNNIYYKGTKEQWQAIKKGNNWGYGAGSYTVHYNYVEEEA